MSDGKDYSYIENSLDVPIRLLIRKGTFDKLHRSCDSWSYQHLTMIVTRGNNTNI